MQNLDKGVVFTTEETMQVKAFGQPLYKDLTPVLDGYMEIVRPRGLPRPFVMLVKSEERMAPPTILFHADPEDQPVYRAVTEKLLQEHLHCYCQPESPKATVHKNHSKGPEL